MGYCFLTKGGPDITVTVLVVKDRNSRAILAHPVLCKGRTFGGAVDQAAESIRRLGHRLRLILKNDNEPARVDLPQGVADALARASGSEPPPK
eukprot:15477187-Alexandrium_andersonii.AAC.1